MSKQFVLVVAKPILQGQTVKQQEGPAFDWPSWAVPQYRLPLSLPSEDVCVQVVLLAEFVSDGNAGEVLAPVALYWIDVEEDCQSGEQANEDEQENTDLDSLSESVWVSKAGKNNNKNKCIYCSDQKTAFLLFYTYLMYGKKAKDRKNPDTKPQMWAKLSIQGSRPKEKKKTEMASSFANARHGLSRICQLWNSSTNKQARMPNWLPAGPTWKVKWEQRNEPHLWGRVHTWTVSQTWFKCDRNADISKTLFTFGFIRPKTKPAPSNAILGAALCRSEVANELYLCSVGQKDGRGQVASDATQHVDDGDPQPASQLLQVPEHRHLEKHRHQAVQDPAGTNKAKRFILSFISHS